ncbi:hypothetical protein A5634_08460 [Mycobacterium asiaticum]|uniref:Uncharacterized protein n=1 Tax=Mycobacterium asiaticum TaxID=1790 RepID=A0A1A3NM93_MYCAS|nr:hypothetical protein [Mycobacterium asiaticum]OBK22184.1 hypothetical protein A5634_08460 [Mycobacterium asiaticum]
MVTPTFDISGHSGRGAARRTRSDDQLLRHRLDVIAADTADAVQTAGGWLFDRVMAGWQVNVLLPPHCDHRPLRILGAHVGDLASDLEDLDLDGPLSQGLAVSAQALTADDRVRELVHAALGNRLTEVALWGDARPLGVDRRLTRTEYQLGAAARAFKAQALRAAEIPCSAVSLVETLYTDAAWLD